jgi:2-hydroxychromene-2-carboxylate isomerase
MVPTLYFDLGSPYAYLAVERAGTVLGAEPVLEPILLGAIFRLRGSGSWAQGPEREPRVADIEARAASYGLPALRWPEAWPANGLSAMRAATWAKQEGRLAPFTRAVFRRQFVDGADIADIGLLRDCARAAGLDPDRMVEAITSEPVKLALRAATDAAWAAGVRGIPTLRIGDQLFYGDDRLEAAAGSIAASPL